MKSEFHQAYLNLGSNIEPQVNLVRAVELLQGYGDVLRVSNAWESRPVGAEGPNYLNACVLFRTGLTQVTLKREIIRPIEARLGRKRSRDKYAPRTMDIDIIIFDNEVWNHRSWKYAFVIVPLAEIHPKYKNPVNQEYIIATATRLRSRVWIEARPEVLSRFSGNSLEAQN